MHLTCAKSFQREGAAVGHSPMPDDCQLGLHRIDHATTMKLEQQRSRSHMCTADALHDPAFQLYTAQHLAETWQVRQDGQQQPPQPESEEQRVVYKSSPMQRSPSEPPEAAPSLSGRQLSADEDTLRQRLISAMQRPSGTESAGQLADTLSLRSAQCTKSPQRADTQVKVQALQMSLATC